MRWRNLPSLISRRDKSTSGMVVEKVVGSGSRGFRRLGGLLQFHVGKVQDQCVARPIDTAFEKSLYFSPPAGR